MAISYNTGATGSRGRAVSDQYADMLRGFDELRAELTEIANSAAGPGRTEALEKGAEIIKDRSVTLAPKRKGSRGGTLKKGIVIGNNTEDYIEVGWTKEAFYGRFLEMGTSKMAPRPHIRPAYEQKKREVFETMLRIMKLK